MPIIDDRTSELDLPLPHVENDMQDDVERLRAALSGVDAFAVSVLLSLAGKAAATHDHPISQVNGLGTALTALAEDIEQRSVLSHTHALSALSDVDVTGATAGQFFKKVGLVWVPANIVISDVASLSTALGTKADLSGNSIIVPSGPTSNRPATPVGKLFRFNETTNVFEGFNGTSWTALDIAAALLKSSNLGDLPSASAAVTNLGLDDLLVKPTTLGMFWRTTAPTGWLKANGAAVLLATYPRLIDMYCGDANNAAAEWGYRCTNPANPTGSRSISGTYIVLPDARGEFLRGWDDGRGVDSGRSLHLSQAQAIQSHTHGIYDPGHYHGQTNPLAAYGPNNVHVFGGAADWAIALIGMNAQVTGISILNTGGTETRPRNLAPLICVKY